MATYSRPRKKDHSIDGRRIVRSDSRAIDNTTQFTSRGDNTAIGDGQSTAWDFSNANNDTAEETFKAIPTNYKRKRLVLSFADAIQIKEGAIYFHNAPKGQYVDFYVVCPSGQYYKDRSGTPQLASGDVAVEHYVDEHFVQGSVPMGDELNTEGANEDPIPNNYELWIEITTPNTDSTSNGFISLEIYRPRTILLPGESL